MALHLLKYHIGQIITHKKFAYRGVIYDADAQFSASQEWYDEVAKSRPPKEAPWYHVLVDGSDITTYVAERNLLPANDTSQINHPLIDAYFLEFCHDHYELLQKQ